ncbi:sensor histidine kinase [Nocardia sp. NPDC127579]|uniref:sensor histidine kinase n=1 Tax=Nocardia sp. NPDC127579 TaxID=3345402 RepID=UPI00363B18D7
MRGRLGDWAIGVAVAAVVLVAGLAERPESGLAPVGYGLLVLSGLALVWRRRAPVPVLVATGACALGYQAIGIDVPAVAFVLAVYAGVRAGHRIVTVAVAVLVLATLPLAVLVSVHAAGVAFAQARGALEIAWLIAAGAAGEALRQAEQRADEAERTREETARRRADAERLHIARELHDSLTHQISVIKVQSEAAVHVARRRGEAVPEQLLAIRQAGREAARELRATLEALRDDDTVPRPGLAHVPDLVTTTRATGLDATLAIAGEPRDLPVTLDRTGYRIVQESLTNITRHADAATVRVRIDYRPDTLVIRVDDDGRADPRRPPAPGVGLLGMRERVTALGGELHAAPRTAGGFSVQAELPVDPA